jgi:phenylalanyl-tRNA synthetase alpha chain
LETRDDPESKRLKRFLNMPDLSRKAGSPIAELVRRILKIHRFADFNDIRVPEIVPADVSFDLFNFPADHPARSKSDTYFIDEKNILRTHTTVMWYYWLMQDEVKKKIGRGEGVGAVSYGKVYRKDEIDRNHMNVFHQMDGWYLASKNQKFITIEDLKEVLTEIAKSIFGESIKYRFNKDEFPYTDPSIEMEIEVNGRWVEVLGSGVVRPIVLNNFGVNPDEYNGWAFGFGLERLAIISMDLPDIRLLWSDDERVKKQLKLGNKFVPVSKYPAITRDISFIVNKDFVPNNYFDLIRDLGGNLVEEVQLIDKYEDAAKFGPDRISYTYRIIYRSNERTLVSSEVDAIQNEIYNQTAKQFKAELR